MQAALCGSAAGGIAGGLVTPLDVTKTRLMLGHDKAGKPYHGMLSTMRRIYHDEGAKAEETWKPRGSLGIPPTASIP